MAAGVAVLLLAGCAGPGVRTPAPVESRVVDPRMPAPQPVPAPQSRDAEVTAMPLGDPSTTRPQPLRPVPRPEPPVSRGGTLPLPEPTGRPSSDPAPGPQVLASPVPAPSPAIDDLLRDVRRHHADGRFEMAAASLERALRIEPRNPYLWQQLAALRLEQGRADQAEQFAAKSNSFAGRDDPLRQRNWRIIAAARRHAGNEGGARDAEARARQYGEATR